MLTGQKPETEQSENSLDILDGFANEQPNTIYLSGPVRKVDDYGRGWREELIDDYGDEFDFINPLDEFAPDTHELINDPRNIDEESDKEPVLPSEYVFEGKRGIREAEYMFVGLSEEIARGTSMECMYAHFYDTPFFVWTRDGQTESGWIYEHAHCVYDDRDKVMDVLSNYE